MPDGADAFKGLDGLLIEHLRHEAHVLVDMYAAPIGDGNSRALLPAVLEREEAEKGYSGHILLRGVDAEYAALLFRIVPFPLIVTVFGDRRYIVSAGVSPQFQRNRFEIS